MKKYMTLAVNEEHQRTLVERKTGEVQLDNEGLLAAIVDSSDDAIVAKSLDGVILSWNAGAQRIFGYTSDEAVGKNISMLIPSDRIHEEKDILFRVGGGGRIEHLETVRRKKNGDLVDISLTVSPIKNRAGRVIGVSKIARDISTRRAAEKNLQNEREFLTAIIDRIPVMITVYDPKVSVLRLNAEFERVVGWSTEEAAKIDLMAECYPDPVYRQKIMSFMQSCEGWMDIKLRTRDNRYLETSWANIRLSDGRQIGIGIDITDRKETEKSLAGLVNEQAALYEFTTRLQGASSLSGVYQAALDAILRALGCNRASILIFDKNGIMRFVNSRGLSEDYLNTVEGHSPWQPDVQDPTPIIMGNVESADIPEDLKGVIQKEGIQSLAFVPLVADGKLIGKFMVYYNEPHEFEESEIELSVTIGRHLAFRIEKIRSEEQRRKTEIALRENEERLRVATGAGKVGIWAWDVIENSVSWTDSLFAIHGVRKEDFGGTVEAFLELIHVDDREMVSEAVTQTLELDAPYEVELRTINSDGKTVWVFANATVQRDEEGRALKMIGATCDITEHKHSEQKLLEADRRKDEFLATLAHELRNPLAPLKTALELISRGGGDESIVESARCMMERQVKHMSRLIDDLMDVSRITCGKLKLRCERVNMADVIQEAINISRDACTSKKHEVRISLPDDPLHVFGDSLRLEQALGNLLNNACKYTPSGGSIEVMAVREGAEIKIKVKDNGVGISPAMLPRVFNLFTQADDSLDRSAGGLGVGLSLVRGLVELHGGSVAAFSDGAGLGSEFVIRLPSMVAEHHPERSQVLREDDKSSAVVPKRYLVVDDNEDAAEMLSLLLEMEGHETRKACDGVEAVKRAEEFKPDIVLLDIGLPRLNGYEACRAIREKSKEAPPVIIAITGWGQADDRRKATEAGFNGHLVKPVDYEALKDILRSINSQNEASTL